MARLVRQEQTGPHRIDPKDLPPDKPIWICACGLSRTLPFCDGTHKTCRDEQPGVLYEYTDQGRREVSGGDVAPAG
jgi:CDGSH-type Zn-finger protein